LIVDNNKLQTVILKQFTNCKFHGRRFFALSVWNTARSSGNILID